jgi:hypothetical protein
MKTDTGPMLLGSFVTDISLNPKVTLPDLSKQAFAFFK